MKKFLCTTLMVVSMFSVLAAPVGAANLTDISFVSNYVETTGTRTCKTQIITCINSGNTVLNIGQYGLTSTVVQEIYREVLLEHPEYYFMDSTISYINSPMTGKVNSITLRRVISAEEATAVESAVSAVVSSVDSSMSDLQKALYVHDYIVQNTTYGYDEFLSGTTNDGHLHDVYGCLVEQRAVCDGYALSYSLIMNRLGISCKFVDSESMGHAWAQVNIDGSWYHVDCTWDDPVRNVQGQIAHGSFLKSDDKMRELGYSSWNAPNTCTSTLYDNAWWNDISSQIVIYGGNYYYISSSGELTKRSGNTVTVLKTVSKGVFLSGFDGYLYYHDNKNIYKYAISSGSVETVYTEPSASSIYSVFVVSVSSARVQYSSNTEKYYEVSLTSSVITGWVKAENSWYYYSLTGQRTTGWKEISGIWYYFNSSGVMSTGWKEISGKWYYFEASGKMATGWKTISGIWYYFASSGAMKTGWVEITGKWYYFAPSGKMVTGWQFISGRWYYFNLGGAMKTGWIYLAGKWYYLRESGVMATGWLEISGKWYYFYDDGVMASDTVIGTYVIDKNGVWIS